MLVKQGSLVKQAFLGEAASLLGKGVLGIGKGLGKGAWKLGKAVVNHPVGAINAGGALYTTGSAASAGLTAVDDTLQTAYRYF